MAELLRITLKAARVNAGLTQKEAAKSIGISESTLIKWEREPETVSPTNYKKITEVYGINADQIFFYALT